MDSSMAASGGNTAAIIGLVIGIVFGLGVLVFSVICNWKLYAKANRPGWASIVPIYNVIVLCEIIGKPTWYWLLLFIPFVDLYIAIVMVNGLSKSFGQSTLFTLGMIFLGVVFVPVLAFGSARYQGPAYALAPSR